MAESPVPVVSGVGHEIDTTICDYAADVRASTPSNAAEIVFPERRELAGRMQALQNQLGQALTAEIRKRELRIGRMREKLSALSPERRIQRLESASEALARRLWQAMSLRTERAGNAVVQAEERLRNAGVRRMDTEGVRLERLRERLEAISPLAVLDRGYALASTAEGHIIATAAEAEQHRDMRLRFADGVVAVKRLRSRI